MEILKYIRKNKFITKIFFWLNMILGYTQNFVLLDDVSSYFVNFDFESHCIYRVSRNLVYKLGEEVENTVRNHIYIGCAVSQLKSSTHVASSL